MQYNVSGRPENAGKASLARYLKVPRAFVEIDMIQRALVPLDRARDVLELELRRASIATHGRPLHAGLKDVRALLLEDAIQCEILTQMQLHQQERTSVMSMASVSSSTESSGFSS